MGRNEEIRVVAGVIDPERIVKPTRLLHESLNPIQAAFARYTWNQCGKFMYSSYEQWEAGFLRDLWPDQELRFWLLVARACEIRTFTSNEQRKAFISRFLSEDPNTVCPASTQFTASRRCKPWLMDLIEKYSKQMESTEETARKKQILMNLIEQQRKRRADQA